MIKKKNIFTIDASTEQADKCRSMHDSPPPIRECTLCRENVYIVF